MDFSYSEEQQAIGELAATIFADHASHERQRELEKRGGPRFSPELWSELARAGLLGIAVPEAQGGGGLGFLEIAVILERAGRSTAPVPLLETTVLGALPLAEFGSRAQRREWLPRVAKGDAILTAALAEPDGDPGRPGVRAVAQNDAWSLEGEKLCVPAAPLAKRILVPAAGEHGEVSVFLVDPEARGVALEAVETTSGRPEAHLRLDGVRVARSELLGAPGDGARVVAWAAERATAGLCAFAIGVCDEALRRTAEYAVERKQFEQPIAMFQAVGHRLADAYVDAEGVRLTALQACWRIAAGLPAQAQVAVAKFWAAEAGQRVVHTAQHLHGGIGVDRDYPLHRYFLHAKHLELQLGGGTRQLLRLGKHLAGAAA